MQKKEEAEKKEIVFRVTCIETEKRKTLLTGHSIRPIDGVTLSIMIVGEPVGFEKKSYEVIFRESSAAGEVAKSAT